MEWLPQSCPCALLLRETPRAADHHSRAALQTGGGQAGGGETEAEGGLQTGGGIKGGGGQAGAGGAERGGGWSDFGNNNDEDEDLSDFDFDDDDLNDGFSGEEENCFSCCC